MSDSEEQYESDLEYEYEENDGENKEYDLTLDAPPLSRTVSYIVLDEQAIRSRQEKASFLYILYKSNVHHQTFPSLLQTFWGRKLIFL